MEVEEAINKRRSIRSFTSDPVGEEDLLQILRAGVRAPNPGNRQEWHFYVIRNKGVLEKMAEAVRGRLAQDVAFAETHGLTEEAVELKRRRGIFSFFLRAPLTIAICAKEEPPDARLRIWRAQGLPEEKIRRMRPHRVLQGVSAAVENMILMAQSLGYGTCWMTGPLIAVDDLESLLGIEPPLRLVALLPLGRPKYIPPLRSRFELEQVVTFID